MKTKTLSQIGIDWYIADPSSTTDRSDSYPISVEELRDHSVNTIEDQTLEAYIAAGTQLIESRVRGGISLISKTKELKASKFPNADEPLTLPIPPLKSISSIQYYDESNASQTLASSDWQEFKPARGLGYLRPAIDAVWPATKVRDDAITITFIAGYGTSSSDVPPTMQHALKMLCGHWIENSDAIVASGAIPKEMPLGVQALVDSNDYGFYA